MVLSIDELQARIAPRAFQYFDSVDSTNDLAAQWLKNGAKTGSAIIADEQRKGRGRLGRIWYTPPNVALAISVILHPSEDALNRMTMLGALAVVEMCRDIGIHNVGIKWPNDVQIGGKKVCGVLPEIIWEDNQLRGVVLGMGVNVRIPFDDELKHVAANIETEAGKPVNRSELVQVLLTQVDHWFAQINSDVFFEKWQAYLTTIGQSVRATNTDNTAIAGMAESVDRDGALLIRTENGKLERVIAGDVTLRE